MKPRPTAEHAIRGKALGKKFKKEEKRTRPNKELLAKYLNKPPTLETLYELISQAQESRENAKVAGIYFLRHLTDTAVERKLAMHANIAIFQGTGTTAAFARALLESRARKLGRTEAKKQLLREIKAVVEKIESKKKQFLLIGETLETMQKEPIKAAVVRHEGEGIVHLAFVRPLNDLHNEIAEL